MGSSISEVTLPLSRDLARYAKRAEVRARPEAALDVADRARRFPAAVSVRALLLEQRREGIAPAAAQRRNPQRALQAIARVARRVKQRVDLEHAHALGAALATRDDLVTGLDFSFLDHAEIEAGPAVLDEQRGHFRLVHANADAGNR